MIDYVILSLTLLAIGIYGLLTKPHFVKLLISIELIATAASMNFVLIASPLDKPLGEAFLILAFSTDTCVTAIVLAILVTLSKKYGTVDIRELMRMARRPPANGETKDNNEKRSDA